MPSSSYLPLEIVSEGNSKSEYELFRESAKEGTPREELIGLTLIDTGLRVSAMAHMRQNWLKWRGEKLYIDVPVYEKCELGSVEKGSGGDRSKSGVPCWYCENRARKDFLPPNDELPNDGNCWHPKSESGWKGRLIPVVEDETAEILMTYFRVYDTVCGVQAVRNTVQRIAKRADLFKPAESNNGKNWPTPHDLRDTYGTKLALMGFNRDQIKGPMGHASIEQADDYIKLTGIESAQVFDKKWNTDLNSD